MNCPCCPCSTSLLLQAMGTAATCANCLFGHAACSTSNALLEHVTEWASMSAACKYSRLVQILSIQFSFFSENFLLLSPKFVDSRNFLDSSIPG